MRQNHRTLTKNDDEFTHPPTMLSSSNNTPAPIVVDTHTHTAPHMGRC